MQTPSLWMVTQFKSHCNTVKLLGVTIDNKLTFTSHIKDLCKRANQKISALVRLRKYLDKDRATLLCNAHILSEFRYCPLIWMFCSKTSNNLINSTHRRALRVVLNDFTTPRNMFFEKHNIETFHTKNIRVLLTEVYKSFNKLNPEFISDLFTLKKGRNLRSGQTSSSR